MFIGDIVKLKPNLIRSKEEDVKFIENAYKEKWLWLVTGIDDEDLDYIIQPMYLEDESKIIQLGANLMVLYDEIETVKITRKELFKKLNEIRCMHG